MSKILLSLPLIIGLALSACSDQGSTIDKPDGKADTFDRLCELAGLESDCDICEDQGWLGDGTCDDFCTTPDPDCDTSFDPFDVTCEFGDVGGVDDTETLEDFHVSDTQDVDRTNINSIAKAQFDQILVAAHFEGQAPQNPTTEEALAVTDDKLFTINTGDIGSQSFTWLQWFAGDTEVGVMFDADSLRIIATIGDGDILSCEPSTPASCGDGSFPVCEIFVLPCEDGLVRETINGCFGECVDPVTCEAPEPASCGDGTVALCEIVVVPCEDGLVRETINGCFGECVDPVTCELPEPASCGDGTVALCEIFVLPCEGGLVRETINGCFGECVDPVTCEIPAS